MEHCLPASPSWYCSRVVDTDDKGLLCFGAKHSIYILDTVADPPKFHGCISAHEDRVVGLSFSKEGDQSRLCSVSEDGRVKIWNLTDGSLCAEHSEHRDKITTVHWSPVDCDLIVSGDDKGGLIIWHPSAGTIRLLSPEHNSIFCLTCSCHVADHVAIGYKNGHVLLLDLSKKDSSVILQKFKGHDDDIHCIAWCPQKGSQLQWRQTDADDGTDVRDSEGYLLASSSRDKTIRVWCVGENKPRHCLKLPQSGQRRSWADTKLRLWVTLYWPKNRTNEIISSSYNGDLLLWNLTATGKQLSPQHFTGRSKCAAHTRIVFNIVSAGTQEAALCSISMDRNLILWDMDSLSTKHVIQTCGGSVYCLAHSPLHSGLLALGVGDNLIRVWNVENSQRPYDVNAYWQGIKSKVTALCWHPVKESQLAFGTEDGKVGILDILSSRSQGSSTYHNRTVYVVTWGPPSYSTDESNISTVNYVLYSCGSGKILQHNPNQLDSNAVDIDSIIKQTNNLQVVSTGRSEIRWKPDYSVVALGNEDGSIDILKAGNLQILCSVHIHRKLVNCVCWHPKYTSEQVEASPNEFWIASGTNEATIQVTDLKKVLELAGKESNTGPVIITESFCILEGHTNRITGLSWSPHHAGQLVSASYDWTAQVWNVNKCQPVANYRAHHGRLLCTLWSALDPDLVYTGSDDFTVHCWRISQQKDKTPPAGSEKRKHRNRNRGPKSDSKQSPQSQNVDKPDTVYETAKVDTGSLSENDLSAIQALLKQKREELQQAGKDSPGPLNKVPEPQTSIHLTQAANRPVYQKATTSSSGAGETTKKEHTDKKKRKIRSLFPLSCNIDNKGKLQTQDDCVHLAETKIQDPIPLLPAELYHLGHFLDRKNSYQLFEKEASHHLSNGNWEQYTILETFCGNVGDSVRMLAERQELNDFAVALSAMASPTTWRATCEAYASQLEKEGNYTKAATYLVAVHQVYEAIDLLQRNGHYKDAICLAQVRLSPDDPLIKKLYSTWGSRLASDANFEHAAKCYIACGQPVHAARLLARRADASALQVACEICIHCRDISTAKIYCHKYVQQCLLNFDWKNAASLVKKEPELKLYGLLITAHQCLLQHLHKLGYLQDMDIEKGEPFTISEKMTPDDSSGKTTMPWLMLDMSSVQSWLPLQPYTVEGEVFIHHLIRQWCSLWDLDMTKSSLEKLNQELTGINHARQTQTAINHILIEITCQVAMVIIQIMLGNDDEAAKWMTVAMATCCDKNLDDVWEGLCRLLLPTGVGRFSNLCQEVRALRLSAVSTQDVTIDQVVTPSGCRQHSNVSQYADEMHVSRVYDDSNECSSVDCLKAFYNLKVLKCYIAKKEQGICERGDAAGDEEISTQCIQDLAHSLLHNAQINRLRLEETLKEISIAKKWEAKEDRFEDTNESIYIEMSGTNRVLDKNPNISEGLALSTTQQEERTCANIPEEWFTLPVGEKYKQPYVTHTMVVREEAIVQKELSHLKQNLKDVPFPNPEQSAKLLIKLLELVHKEDSADLKAAIRNWAVRHCFTNEALDYFK